MRQDTYERYKKVLNAIESGSTLVEALKAFKMGTATYYKLQEAGKEKKQTVKREVKAVPNYIDIPPAVTLTSGKVLLIYCDPIQAISIAESFR